MKSPYYWYCPSCDQEVGSYNVTFDENCALCGCPVEVKNVDVERFNDARINLWNEIVKTFRLIEIMDWIENKLRRFDK